MSGVCPMDRIWYCCSSDHRTCADAFGLGVDLFTTPPALIVTGHAGLVAGLAVGAVDGIDLRSRNIETLDEIIAGALDYYSHLKSITQQVRQTQLREARGLTPEPQELSRPGNIRSGATEVAFATTPERDHRGQSEARSTLTSTDGQIGL